MANVIDRPTVIALTLVLSAYSLAIACRSPHSPQADADRAKAAEQKRETDSLKAVFSSFTYVAKGSYIPNSIPAHTMDNRAWPADFEAGRQYIFHSKDRDNDRLFKEIQETLRAKGFTILAAKELAYRNVGGLLFRITFSSPTRTFLFYNDPDQQILRNAELSRSWSQDDYVLSVYKRNALPPS